MSRKIAMVPAAALMMAIALAGCGGTSSDSRLTTGSSKSANFTSSDTASDIMDSAAGSSGENSGFQSYESADAEDTEEQSASDETTTATANGTDEDADALPESMIRRTADIELTTKKYDEADKAISKLVKKYSVVTIADNSSNDTYYSSSTTHRVRTVRMRVKSEKFDEFCDTVNAGKAWDIEEMDKSAEDVTKQYNDNTQKIDALQTRYKWYKERIEKSDDEEIVRDYSDDMFDALEEITYLENANSNLTTDVTYSIVNLTLTEDVETAVVVDKSNDVWEDVSTELSVLPENIMTAFGSFVLIIIKLVPALIFIAIFALIALLIARAYKSYKAKHPDMRPVAAPAVRMPPNGWPAAPQERSQDQKRRTAYHIHPVPPMPAPEPPILKNPVASDATPSVTANAGEGESTATDEPKDNGSSDGMTAFHETSKEVKGFMADSDEFSKMFSEDDDETTDGGEDTSPSIWDGVPDASYEKIDDLRDPDDE